MARVLVLMSGGVDSSIAAFLLKEEGHEVAGMTMIMWRSGSRCCDLEDIEDAKRVAAYLRIPHCTLDMEDDFRSLVVNPFVSSSLSGSTPNPCTLCNRDVKFGMAFSWARRMGFDLLATGHHALIERRGEDVALLEGGEEEKSQAYFLSLVRRDALSYSLFPVGRLAKDEVRRLARSAGLPVAEKGESQEVCFIPEGGLAHFLEEEGGVRGERGAILDRGGALKGEHRGYFRFTRGQRRGLGIGHTAPLYVVCTNPERNEVVVGERDELYSRSFTISSVNWLAEGLRGKEFTGTVRARYRQRPVPALITPLDGEGRLNLAPEIPLFAVTRGQIGVINRGKRVIAGGVIEEVLPR